jgi:hypothetical protein
MAFLEGFNFTGGLGEFTAYRRRGSSKIVLRRKGGASKEMILNSPQFALPRKNMSEFGGCSTMGQTVRRMTGSQRNLADFNISGPINALLRVVQNQDKQRALGRRSIELSKYPGMLEGFSFNERVRFDSIVRNTISWSISRETLSAHVDIPHLMPGVNFFTQNKAPMFSFVLSLGVIPDHFYDEALGIFKPNDGYQSGWGATEIYTPWMPAAEGSEAFTVEIQEKTSRPPDAAHSLILTIGIRFGTVYGGGITDQVKKIGASKVLAVQ